MSRDKRKHKAERTVCVEDESKFKGGRINVFRSKQQEGDGKAQPEPHHASFFFPCGNDYFMI